MVYVRFPCDWPCYGFAYQQGNIFAKPVLRLPRHNNKDTWTVMGIWWLHFHPWAEEFQKEVSFAVTHPSILGRSDHQSETPTMRWPATPLIRPDPTKGCIKLGGNLQHEGVSHHSHHSSGENRDLALVVCLSYQPIAMGTSQWRGAELHSIINYMINFIMLRWGWCWLSLYVGKYLLIFVLKSLQITVVWMFRFQCATYFHLILDIHYTWNVNCILS